MTAKLEVQSLRKEFGSLVAVDGISLTVPAGEVLGFLGPNGAGKSTTMKMITGFLLPTAGTTRICGIDVAADPVAAKARLGYLPEGAPLYPEMTPASLLAFAAEVRGLAGAKKHRRLDEMAERVHLKEVWRQSIETLSKGFKRRVGLALALLHDPEVLILDEPTDGLDPNQKHEVRNLVREIARDKAIVISTHILEEVEALCHRVVIIDRGRIVADGTPAQLEARSPRHGAVSLRVDELKAAPLAQALEGLAGVARVEKRVGDDGQAQLTAFPATGAAIAPAVAELLREPRWPAAEWHLERGRLDEVFRTLTQKEAAGGRA